MQNKLYFARSQNQTGFTLAELLITLLIIGIISCFAYPSYQHTLYKARRHDALSSLIHLQAILEHCYQQHHSYIKPCLRIPHMPYYSQQNHYQITFSDRNENHYTLLATPINEQTNDTNCAYISINQANVKTALNHLAQAAPNCWRS